MAFLVNCYFPKTISTQVPNNFYRPDRVEMEYKLRGYNLKVYEYYAYSCLSAASTIAGAIGCYKVGLMAAGPALILGVGIGFGTFVMRTTMQSELNDIQNELKQEHLHIGGYPKQVRSLYFRSSSEFLANRLLDS